MQQLAIAELKLRLSYEKDTGKFTWKVNSRGAKCGDIAGSIKKDGYVYITVKRKVYAAHRLVWFFENGCFPEGIIDHINRDKSDNRISNLRLATKQQNAANAGPYSTNKSGYKGVAFNKRDRRYIASITVNGVKKSLGSYTSAIEASEAYVRASVMYNKDFSPY